MSEKRDLENDLGHAVRMTRFELTEALEYWGRLAKELEAENTHLREALEQAQAQAALFRSAIDAAIYEGLREKVSEFGHSYGDGSLADLVERRILHIFDDTNAGLAYAERMRKLEAMANEVTEAYTSYLAAHEPDREIYRWQVLDEAMRKLKAALEVPGDED